MNLMKKIFLMMTLPLALISCERQEMPKTNPDRDSTTKTAIEPSNDEFDRAMTKKIREVIKSDASLSTNAKNITIITIKGIVTLRGPVASPQEKKLIEKKTIQIPGVLNVDNQLEAPNDY